MRRALAFYFAGKIGEAQWDWTQVIDGLPGAPVERIAKALYNRGVTWGKKGDTEKELADYTHVIDDLPGAPIESVAQALVNRGVIWGRKGDTEKELADYSRVIDDLPGAPVEQIAQALYNRGLAWGQKGDTEKELADYSRVIDGLPGAPAEWIAKALAARGWIYYEQNDFLHFLSDTETSLQKDPSLDFAAFNKGLALLALRRDVDALATYRMAKEQFPSKVDTLGIPDLEDAQKNWLSPERAKPILDLLRAG